VPILLGNEESRLGKPKPSNFENGFAETYILTIVK